MYIIDDCNSVHMFMQFSMMQTDHTQDRHFVNVLIGISGNLKHNHLQP